MWLLYGILASPYSWLIIAAVVPAIFLMVRVYKADKMEREPFGLLLKLALFGALSCIPAGFAEGIGDGILQQTVGYNSLMYNILMYFGVVAFAEEGFKLLLLRLGSYRNPNFNCRFDGIVYAVFVSLGFALLENISYVLDYGLGTALVRAITSIPGHASFGVFMGVYYGQQKLWENYREPGKARRCGLLALLVPALLHGAYDFLATLSSDGAFLLFLVFIVLMFLLANRSVRKGSTTDVYIGNSPVKTLEPWEEGYDEN